MSYPTTGDAEAIMRSTINDNVSSNTRYNALKNVIIGRISPISTLVTLGLPAEDHGDGRCDTPIADPSLTLKLIRHDSTLYAKVPTFEE